MVRASGGRYSLLIALIVASAALAPSAAAAIAAAPQNLARRSIAADYGTHRIIVKLKDGYRDEFNRTMSPDRVGALSLRANVRLRSLRAMSGNAHVLAMPQALSGENLKATVERLRADPAVEYAYADTRERLLAVPNDPLYSQQYYLKVPDATPGSFTASAIDAPPAWDITTGSTAVVVGLIDGGVRFDHPDLGGELLAGYDFVSEDCSPGSSAGCTVANQFTTANDGNGRDSDASDPGDWVTASEVATNSVLSGCDVSDSSWHGTHVAGIIGARGNNTIGIAGVNWSVALLPVRVFGKCGGYQSDIIDGMRWAAGIAVPGVPLNPNPAKVLNLSLGGAGSCSASAYLQAVADVTARGVIVVAAAGNEDAEPIRPANCPGVISVGAVRGDGLRTSYSNSGSGLTIMAPGGDFRSPTDDRIVSTDNSGTTTPAAYSASGFYAEGAGTSFSTAIVTGVVGLMLAADPALTPQEAKDVLIQSARPFVTIAGQAVCVAGGTNNASNTTPCNCTTAACGAGYVDAGAAVVRVQALAAARPAPPATTPSTTPTTPAVTSSNSGGGGGGGGSIDALSLAILSGVAIAARLRRKSIRRGAGLRTARGNPFRP